MTSDVPELPYADLVHGSPRSRFAIVETMHNGQRVLCFMEDQVEATEMARELRRRGVMAGAFRTRS